MNPQAANGHACSTFAVAVLGAVLLATSLGFAPLAHADREMRGAGRTSVNQNTNANRSANVNQSANVNRTANVNQSANVNRTANVNQTANVNRNVNVNQNVNVNKNVNVNVNNGGSYYNDHPIATAAAVTATVAVTAAAIGSMTRTLPPACSAMVVNGITYQNCGGAWYQPQYAGSQVTYVVVNPPR